ncbi:MAG TPA: AAA family ATPase [Longimicrobium sp.]|nr:AAA family ATPase [Longimicrobium sp.]
MKPFTVTLKNYRCFEDRTPVTIEIRPGCTALIGPNNSGKSSFLKAFYELRPLFRSLDRENGVAQVISERGIDMSFLGIDDAREIPFNRHERDVRIQLDFKGISETQPRSLVLMLDLSKQTWFGEVIIGSGRGRREVRLERMDWNNDWIYSTSDGMDHHLDLTPLMNACNVLATMMYVGPYRNAINSGSGRYYDLSVGTQFINDWDDWKTGNHRIWAEAMQTVTEDVIRIFGYRRVEISAANNKTALQIAIDGKPYRLHELGAGIAQFIMVLASVAMKRPSFLLIDEPELHLHPSLQIEFLTAAASYATEGVLFASHSLGLARATAERVYSFQKPGNNAEVSIFEQTPNYPEFVGELSFSSFRELGHEWILLVEGPTEVKAIQQFLRFYHMDHSIVVVPLGGTALIREGVVQELAELRRLSGKIAVLIDSERTSPRSRMSVSRQKFLEDCKALGFKVHATERRAFENYLTERAIQKFKGPKYHALKPFELLDAVEPKWAKHENWRIAREMEKDEIAHTDLGRFLSMLRD